MSAPDAFALGGRNDDTLTALPIIALWEFHRNAVAAITKLDGDDEIEPFAQDRDKIEDEICRRMTTSIPELIVQATLLRSYIGLGEMADDIDLKLCANIILGLQQINANSLVHP